MAQEPVLVVIKAADCGHCTNLKQNWQKYVDAFRAANINVRIVEINQARRSAPIDTNIFPGGLRPFLQWFPMLVLIPGDLWNNAMLHLGSNNISFTDRAIIFNGSYNREKGVCEHQARYPLNPDGVVNWLREAMSHISNDHTNQSRGSRSVEPLVPGLIPRTIREQQSTSYAGQSARHIPSAVMGSCSSLLRIVPRNQH